MTYKTLALGDKSQYTPAFILITQVAYPKGRITTKAVFVKMGWSYLDAAANVFPNKTLQEVAVGFCWW